MKHLRRGILVSAQLLMIAGLATAASAQTGSEWGPPKKPYIVDLKFTDGQKRSREARLYFTPQRQRLEFKAGKKIIAILVDLEKKRVFHLFLTDREYTPVRAIWPEYYFGMSRPDAKLKKLGVETLNGLKVIKYQVSSKTNYGDKFEGTGWATADRIIVKMEGMIIRGKRKLPFKMVAQNVRLGPIAPALFEIPDGYKLRPAPKSKKK
jgi:hypothetical protein